MFWGIEVSKLAIEGTMTFAWGFIAGAWITLRKRRQHKHQHTWELVKTHPPTDNHHYMYAEYKCLCGEGKVEQVH